MKLSRVISIALLMCSVSQSTYAEDCNELLNLGYMNINHSVNSYDSVVSAYNLLCSESYNSASESTKKGMSFSFDFLKKLSGSFGKTFEGSLTQENWSKVCEDKELYTRLSTYQSINSSEISSVAMSAWKECLALNARGLKPNFSATSDLTGLTGTLYWAGSTPIFFTGVDNSGVGTAACNITYHDGKQYVTKPTTSSLVFKLGTKAASFSCRRKTSLDSQSRIMANATRLTFKTSEGKIDFDLAPITLTQIDAKQIDGIYQKLSGIDNDLVGKQQSLDKLSSQITTLSSSQQTQSDQITALNSATKVIFTNTCPAGWVNYGQVGMITLKGSYVYSLLVHGGNYNSGWDWAHPVMCVRN